MSNYGFKYYRLYGYYIAGVEVRGTIGNPHRTKYWYDAHPTWTPHVSYHGSWTYRVRQGKQEKMLYYNPGNKKTNKQLAQQDKLRQAVLKWHSLTEQEKQSYRNKENWKTIHEGFCFFVSEYIKKF